MKKLIDTFILQIIKEMHLKIKAFKILLLPKIQKKLKIFYKNKRNNKESLNLILQCLERLFFSKEVLNYWINI